MTDHDLTNETHRAECAECAATWAELEAIAAEARTLPTLTPSRDLWAGIEARLGARPGELADGASTSAPVAAAASRPAGGAMARAERRWPARVALRYAAAAALLMTVTATVTWRIATDPELGPVAQGPGDERPAVEAREPRAAAEGVAEAPVDGPAEPSGLDRAAVLREAGYEPQFEQMDLEISGLQTLLERRRRQLDPATIEVLERNLALIDQAIAESRAALARDPASQFLASRLARSYTTKLTLLRSTATMPSGT